MIEVDLSNSSELPDLSLSLSLPVQDAANVALERSRIFTSNDSPVTNLTL